MSLIKLVKAGFFFWKAIGWACSPILLIDLITENNKSSLYYFNMNKHKEELSIALVQMCSSEIVHQNFNFILEILNQISSINKPVDLICFPENSLFMRVNDKIPVQIIDLKDSFFDKVAEFARKLECFIHLGSFAIEIDGKVYNSTVWSRPRGEIVIGYQKMHLFDIALEGQKPIQESASFAHGSQPKIQNIFGWNLGESICYDIRFAELYNFYALNGADLILIPAAFLASTGRAHWEILVKARAIECQSYVLASCQSGKHKNLAGDIRQTYGHSMLIDPWGREILNMREELGFQMATISKSNILRVRNQMPMANHRRDFLRIPGS